MLLAGGAAVAHGGALFCGRQSLESHMVCRRVGQFFVATPIICRLTTGTGAV